MAKIERKHQKIFGASAPTVIGKFGSLADGTATTTVDPDVIQALSAYDTAWNDAVLADNAFAIEDLNGLEFNDTYQLAYLLQSGIPEWNTDAVYYVDDICRIGNIIYVSKVDDNTGNDPTADTTNWGKGLNIASLEITDTTDSSSAITGAVKIAGGLGVEKNIYAGTGFYGNVTGGVTGNVTGNVTGDVTGDVTGNVIGITDGSAIAAGYVGEVVEYSVTSNVDGSTTLGTVTDGLTGCTLSAGNWRIEIRGCLTANCSSGSGLVALTGLFHLTDNSNNILFSDRAGVANDSAANLFSNYNFTYDVSITASTTYKLRFSLQANNGTPVASFFKIYATSDSPVYFKATRIS